MNAAPRQISLPEWDARHADLVRQGLREPCYGGPLGRHLAAEGDLRLRHLRFDNSAAALRLWNFLLTENQRLHAARQSGELIVGTMKDLGTVPVMAYALPRVRAFYPDGAWWTPCLMECSDGLLQQAERCGIDAAFCPVRAMLPAFVHGGHFPIPDLLICSAGAVCDDFTAIAQRLEHLGFPISWWEIPRRRAPDPGEPACLLPGGFLAPQTQVDCVRGEFQRLAALLGQRAGQPLDDAALANGIRQANVIRRLLARLRQTVHAGAGAALPALEMLIAEMLAIHFCSDRLETEAVLTDLLREAERRAAAGHYAIASGAARVYWVNPVADLRLMNCLEELGGRICGTEYMFTHALDVIPEDLPPLEALARTTLADPMIGSAADRARRILAECRAARAEALVIARIPGASHCAREGEIIAACVQRELGIPCLELEIPPVADALLQTLKTRLQALIETCHTRRS
ncbi:MAG: 2-hydroxyacyl-CoA dehydratase family protein [Verrucomicrobiota bacterium]